MNKHPLLMLLACFLHGKSAASAPNWDWSVLIALAQRQGVLPIVAYLAEQDKLCPDPALAAQLKAVLMKSVYTQNQRAAAFEVLSQELTAAGIDHLPIKGWYLRELYPVPELRTFGDIDIVIHPEDRERSDGLFRRAGFKVEVHGEPTCVYERGIEYYEVHTKLFKSELGGRQELKTRYADPWGMVRPVEGRRYALDDSYHFVYTVLHLAKHLYAGGAGLRMYYDIALQVDRNGDKLDWKWIEEEFRTLDYEQFFHTLLRAVEYWFGVALPVEAPVVPGELLDTLAIQVLEGSVFMGSVQSVAAMRISTYRDRWGGSRFSVLRRRLFPPAEKLRESYPFARKHWSLLPVAWVVRLVKNSGQIKGQINELQQIATLDEGEVTAYDTFMREIGL